MSKAAQLQKARDLEGNEINDPMQYFDIFWWNSAFIKYSEPICQPSVLALFSSHKAFPTLLTAFFLVVGPQILSQACGNS